MTLYMAEKALKIKIPLKILQWDFENFLDPLFNRDKSGNRPIMNHEFDREENSNINHRARHVIKMTQDWIKKPFNLDPLTKIVIFHAQAFPTKGRGKKVIVPTFSS